MGFQALAAWQRESDGLSLTIADHTFIIGSPSAKDGLRLEALINVAQASAAQLDPAERDVEVLSDGQEMDLYRLALGNSFDEALDKLSWADFKHLANTAIAWHTMGDDRARLVWESRGKAQNRQQRRAKTKRKKKAPSGTPSPHMGGENRTP